MKDVVPLLVSGGHQHLPLVPQVLSEDDQLPPCPGQKLQPDVFIFNHQDHNLSLTPEVINVFKVENVLERILVDFGLFGQTVRFVL